MIGLLAELAVALLTVVGAGGGLRRAPSLADMIVVIAGGDYTTTTNTTAITTQQQQQLQCHAFVQYCICHFRPWEIAGEERPTGSREDPKLWTLSFISL